MGSEANQPTPTTIFYVFVIIFGLYNEPCLSRRESTLMNGPGNFNLARHQPLRKQPALPVGLKHELGVIISLICQNSSIVYTCMKISSNLPAIFLSFLLSYLIKRIIALVHHSGFHRYPFPFLKVIL